MPYPTVSAPYGLVPIKSIGGRPYAGATTAFPIASGYAANIFNGDVVTISSDGVIVKDTGTTAATPVGVFQGCSYTDPVRGFINSNYYPTGTVASDITAYVADDPDLLFKIAIVSATTVISSLTTTSRGLNASIVQNAGVTATGNSRIALLSTSAATTNTLPLRIVDFVRETASGANFSEAIVKWNAGMHQYYNATGV
jgi:hypothetical protein